mgnify:CR=1 FL=1
MTSEELALAIQAHLDDLTKPKGSLGKLETYAKKLAIIQNRVPPKIDKKAVFVLAGDHGIVEEGVSLYPKEVSAQMVHNFMAGGAGINVLARACNFDIFAVDAGVDADFPDEWNNPNPHSVDSHGDGHSGSARSGEDLTSTRSPSPHFFAMKACRGSANFSKKPALTSEEFAACIEHGKSLAAFALRHRYDMVAIGDMGIGNTSSAAALAIAFGLPADAIIDRGTGIDDSMLKHKYEVITQSVAKHCQPHQNHNPEYIGQCFAGPELATAAGLILGLKSSGIACMIDGFPITSAALLASKFDPTVTEYCFAGHESHVKGHKVLLDALGLEAVVKLEMRLGEGTGAVIGGFIVSLGAHIASEMATFSSMKVSQATKEELDY